MKEKTWDAVWMILLTGYICVLEIQAANLKGRSDGELFSMWPVWVAFGNITLSLIISIRYLSGFRQKFYMHFPLLIIFLRYAFDPQSNKWTVWLMTVFALTSCYAEVSSSRRNTQSTGQTQSNLNTELTE
jgi:hypothetical protein